MGQTTMRDRILAVIRREEHDRVPFVQYDNLAAPNEEIWRQIGRDNLGIIRWSKVYRFEHPNCRFESESFQRNGGTGVRTTLFTPVGSLEEEKLIEPTYGTGSIREHFVREPDDYPVLMAYLRDVKVVKDTEQYLRNEKELGDDGIPMASVERTPYQQLWIQWVSLMDLSLHFVDFPERVGECMDLLADIERRIFAVVREVSFETELPFVNFPDNITAPTIGEPNFRRYCLPLYDELTDMLADWNVPTVVHADGDLKPLWQALAESRICGLDSFSPSPDNDTSVAQAASLWPDKHLAVNFPSSVHIAGPDAVYETACRILEEAGHTGRIWFQISENVPIGVWRTSYPQIARAIADFGKP